MGRIVRPAWVASALCAVAGLVLVLALVGRGASGSAEAAPDVPAAAASAQPAPTPEPTVEATPSPLPTATEPPALPDPGASAPLDAPVWAEGLAVLPTVELAAAAEFGTGVTATLDAVTRVDGVGRLPGERSAPALAITVALHNDSDAPVVLDDLVVDLYAPDGRVGGALTQDPRSAPMSGTLVPGATASGTYVRLLPDPASDDAGITVSYGGALPAVAFQGSVPR